MSIIEPIISQLASTRVLCVGDIMLDQFSYGSVQRISPEAPVPIFKMEHSTDMLGGAGNVIANLASLGCTTTFAGVIGADAHGATVLEFMQSLNCQALLLQLADYPTTVKVRFVAGHQHILRADNEMHLCLTATQEQELLAQIQAALPQQDIVLLSDYGKGLFTISFTQSLIALCNAAGAPVLVDPKGTDYSRYAGATLVKPNRAEFEQATGETMPPTAPDFIQRISTAAQGLMSAHSIANFCVTLSEHGMIYLSRDASLAPIHIPTQAQEVFDVSGAGDTSLAVLGAALGTGESMADAMQLANLASGIVVGKLGTASVSLAELSRAYSQKMANNPAWRQRAKIVTVAEAIPLVKELQSAGKTVGFTNGCYDLLHLGHLDSFIQAKAECDALIVGINSDASVRKLKGDSRPVHDEHTRSMLLASLEFIDYVIIFSDDTAIPLVQALRPDVLAKEGYTIDNWPEAQFAQSYGARVVTLKRIEGYSTTNLIQRLQQEQ